MVVESKLWRITLKPLTFLILVGFFPLSVFASAPKVVLRDSWVFDSWCSRQNGNPIHVEEAQKLDKILPDLQAAWNNAGPAMLKKTPSMSMPLLINGNWFVSESPRPVDLVADIVSHELIHTYLVDNFRNRMPTPLLTKYRNEDGRVLSHLHLMAIQKEIYLELGLNARIEGVIKFDSEVLAGSYKRSWEIVNAEGADKFVEELK